MHIYLIQLSLVWLSCWLLYTALLKREKFFQLNRFYLLGTIIFGLVLPLMEWPNLAQSQTVTPWLSQPVIWLQTITIQAQNQVIPINASWHWADTLVLLYGIISFGFLLRFSHQFYYLYQNIQQGEKHWENGICWIYGSDNQSPCSWMHYLFWNENTPSDSPEAAAIIAHEKAHIRQRHSWDILLLELLGLFFWWHPLWYLYRRELTDVHEYQADHASTLTLSIHEYGHLLLKQHLQHPTLSLVQHFNSSHLKKRIIMMTKSPSNNSAFFKYLLLLPLMLVLAFACEETEQDMKETAASLEENDKYYERLDTVTTFNPTDQSESVEFVKTKIYNEPDHMPVFGPCDVTGIEERKKCSNQNMLTYIYSNRKYPKEASSTGQEGTVLISIIVGKSGRVDGVELIKEKTTEHDALNEEALSVIRDLPNFEPGTQDGKPVNVKIVLPIKFQLE